MSVWFAVQALVQEASPGLEELWVGMQALGFHV